MGFITNLIRGERTYEEGVTAGRVSGIKDTLDALGGVGDRPGRYTGPVPLELREWMVAIRERLNAP